MDKSLQYKRANQWISRNSLIAQRKQGLFYIVLPNATFSGKSLRGQIFVNNGAYSFFHLEKASEDSTLMLRGYKNKTKYPVQTGKWWHIDAEGKNISEKKNLKSELSIVTFLTKRIPTIILARELMFRKYSAPLYEKKLTKEKLGTTYGYRMWKSSKEKNSDLKKRIKFLDEYVRRTETTLLKEARNLYKSSLKSKKGDFFC